ncbi:MAG: uroporphyrinogen-III synthase [Methylococcaceae bacterium]
MLNNVHVLVTRPTHQAENLANLVKANGGIPICFPTLAIVEADNFGLIQQKLQQLDTYQWLVFTSVNAVDFALKANSGKIAEFKLKQLAAVGLATAKQLEKVGLSVNLVPKTGFSSEALLAMPQLYDIAGLSFLVVRGQGGREVLADGLVARGARVDYLEVYKRVMPDIGSVPASEQMDLGKLDVITVTSAQVLQNLVAMLAPQEKDGRLFNLTLVVISERLGQIAQELGFKRIVVAENAADAAILESIITVCNGEECGRID